MLALAAALLALPVAAPAPDDPPGALAPARMRLVQLTDDGLPDKLHLGADGSLAVSVNLGRGRFARVEQELPATTVSDVLVSDLDGDGHRDLYLVSPAANRALLGDGRGGLLDATGVLGLADDGLGLGAERVDMDGEAPDELVVHNADGDVLFWALGAGFARDVDSQPLVADGAAGFAALQQLLPHLSVVWLDDGAGGTRKTVRFSGVNVQIVNGLRATNGNTMDPYAVEPVLTATNGVGNLIVGYDEPRFFGNAERTGSHNIVLGKEHTYTSFGGLVAGDVNRVTAPYSSAAGGRDQTCSGLRSAVLGGQENVAAGEGTAILGGGYNCAQGHLATASGGAYNLVPGPYAHVCAGEMNVAAGITSSIAGGADVQTTGVSSVGVGGYRNLVGGYATVVVGGDRNTTDGELAVVVGGSFNRAGPDGALGDGTTAVVVGGRNNLASGFAATVAGGGGPLATDGNVASGPDAAVSGGRGNTASGAAATVGGGLTRAASGDDDWAAGSLHEDG